MFKKIKVDKLFYGKVPFYGRTEGLFHKRPQSFLPERSQGPLIEDHNIFLQNTSKCSDRRRLLIKKTRRSSNKEHLHRRPVGHRRPKGTSRSYI